MQIPQPRIITEPLTSLQIEDLELGTGKAAQTGQKLLVRYYGTLARTGERFDDNLAQPEPFALVLGQGQVIAGWEEGLVGLQVGGMRRLAIPAEQAYGGNSPSPTIPPFSDLVFVVVLVDIQKA